MATQDAALGKAAGIEKKTGYSQYNPTPGEKQAISVEWWRRQAELRNATQYQRELYRAVKLRLGGGLL